MAALDYVTLALYFTLLGVSVATVYQAYCLLRSRLQVARRYGRSIPLGGIFAAVATLSLAVMALGVGTLLGGRYELVGRTAEALMVILLASSMSFFLRVSLDVYRGES